MQIGIEEAERRQIKEHPSGRDGGIPRRWGEAQPNRPEFYNLTEGGDEDGSMINLDFLSELPNLE